MPGRKQKFPTIPGKWNSAFFGNLHYNPHHQSRMFRHKNIRLPLDRYVGTAWFFVTFCCENRKKIFLEPTRAQWFLDDLRSDALSHALAIHAYCVMPDHVHLLSQGLTPTSDLFRCLTALKKRTGFTYKQETSHHLWQKKSYDYALRSGDPPDLVAWYIWMNPVRAGLCLSATDYPWSGSLTGAGPHSTPPHESWSRPWRNQPAPI